MKRKELEKKLRQAGCYLKRKGGSHSLWMNPQTGVVEYIPYVIGTSREILDEVAHYFSIQTTTIKFFRK